MLTQAEIDAMLAGTIEIEQRGESDVNLKSLIEEEPAAAAAPGRLAADLGDRNVRAYNFWSPNRFTKEQIRAVELLHEDLAERLTTSMPAVLRTDFRPRVVHIEQGRFDDFLKDLPPASLFHMISFVPLPGQLVLTISPNISAVLLEYQLGGKVENMPKVHGLTEIDQSLMRGIVESMLNDIKTSWSKVTNVEPTLEDSTINHRWVQMMMGSDRMLMVTFEVNVHSITGTMTIYIPFTMIKPITGLLNPHILISGTRERKFSDETRQKVLANMYQVKLPFVVTLGRTELTLKELLELKAGDIVQLDTSVKDDLKVTVADRERFEVQIGKIGNRLAAQVTNILELKGN